MMLKSAMKKLLFVNTVTTNQPSSLRRFKENAIHLHFAVTKQTNPTQSPYPGILYIYHITINLNVLILFILIHTMVQCCTFLPLVKLIIF